MALKHVWFFAGDNFGWSETYYTVGDLATDLTASLAQYRQAAQGVISAGLESDLILDRIAILQDSYQINHIRVSIDGGFRQELAFDPPNGRLQGAFLPKGVVPLGTLPEAALLCKWIGQDAAAQLHTTNHYLGGLNTLVNPFLDSYIPTAGGWDGLIGLFFRTLRGAHWRMKVEPNSKQGNPPVLQGSAITAFTIDPSGLFAYVSPDVVGAGGLTVSQVLVTGVRVPHGWNGSHRGESVVPPGGGANVTRIGPTRKPGVSVPLWSTAPLGRIRLGSTADVEYLPILQTIDDKIVKKDRGRPFGLPRGRRSRA